MPAEEIGNAGAQFGAALAKRQGERLGYRRHRTGAEQRSRESVAVERRAGIRGTEEERRSLSGLSDADAAAIMNGLTPGGVPPWMPSLPVSMPSMTARCNTFRTTD